MINFLKKYRQAWVLLYVFIYFPWFFYLEKTVVSNFYVVHTRIDDYIPFCEYFVIPYLFWFIYVAGTVAYFLFKRPKAEFYRLTAFLFIGMTVCLAICTVFPNGQLMRPVLEPDKNIFTRLIAHLYTADTSTNVFPSIHVYASIGISLAYAESEISKNRPWIKWISLGITILICLSTVFLKQHSVIDGIGAIFLSLPLYLLVYRPEGVSFQSAAQSKRLRRNQG